MFKTEIPSRDLGVSPGRATPAAEEIRRQLRNILASPVFHGSKRCQQFLEHVCEKALSGEAGALKERMIAIEVFGRQPQTELGEDTIVRVGAREVRKRLAQYYVTPEGAAAEVRIDLPPGSYSPDFRYVTAVHEDEPRVAASIVAGSWGNRLRSRASLCGVEPGFAPRRCGFWVCGAFQRQSECASVPALLESGFPLVRPAAGGRGAPPGLPPVGEGASS